MTSTPKYVHLKYEKRTYLNMYVIAFLIYHDVDDVCICALQHLCSICTCTPPPIQVTRLERDASSGTALQEISFWLNLENALNKIHLKRDSPEVDLTLEVLKAGKRFHTTLSFDSDTGLTGSLYAVVWHCRFTIVPYISANKRNSDSSATRF